MFFHLQSLYSDSPSFVYRADLKDKDRLTTLIRMTASDLAMSLANSGHKYAMTHASSSLTPAAQRSEQFTGLTQVTSDPVVPVVETTRYNVQKRSNISYLCSATYI